MVKSWYGIETILGRSRGYSLGIRRKHGPVVGLRGCLLENQSDLCLMRSLALLGKAVADDSFLLVAGTSLPPTRAVLSRTLCRTGLPCEAVFALDMLAYISPEATCVQWDRKVASQTLVLNSSRETGTKTDRPTDK